MDFKLQILTDHQIRTTWEVMNPLELLTITDEGWYYAFLSARTEAMIHGRSYECICWPDGSVVFLERAYPFQKINVDELLEIYRKANEHKSSKFVRVPLYKD